MNDSERISSIPSLREEGNTRYKEGNYKEASTKYSEALGRLEQLMLREKPNDEEWNKLNEMKMPLLLNYAQCQLLQGEYYTVIEHCTTVLDKDPGSFSAPRKEWVTSDNARICLFVREFVLLGGGLSQSEEEMALSTMKPGGKAVLVPLSLALLVVRADIDINNFITSLNHLRTTMEEYVGCDQRMEKLWEDIMTRNKMFNHLNERLLSKMDQLAKIRERDEIQSECKPPFQVFRGYCLLLNTVSSLDWAQARFVCWVKGGDLAYPWSLQDLKDFLPKTESTTLGSRETPNKPVAGIATHARNLAIGSGLTACC
ncbi:uncharacterized protein LOC119583325 [Penaeus monodon]|uniref:uncharacterized protein LOC119583325 n=1 Tax=Penaeus monodon TaxID=6687 RepID=UPI0018A75248|nr:uncharacterized protein LOC119583325 [Penaeus monodon]